MNDEPDDSAFFFAKKPGRTTVSRSFTDVLGQQLRIASRVADGEQGLQFAIVKDETVLRTTPAGRYEVKATFLEDNREVKTLTIQRYRSGRGPVEREHFSFVGPEIEALQRFLISIKTATISDSRKFRLSDEELKDVIFDDAQFRKIVSGNEALFQAISNSDELKRDLIAVGYRRKQLERFTRLLNEKAFFEEEKKRLSVTPEAVWQNFFERNKWIFGYGLAYQFLTSLDDKKLEQIVRGFDITGPGKRADALMKTQGLISSLCFVEIKRHDTQLLVENPYRSGTWSPTKELAGGVAQTQVTVQESMEKIGRKLSPTDQLGNPTGEVSFNVAPRSFLIIGSNEEFMSPMGINETKVQSFELFRRNTHRPEILTFDELYSRAKFIVEQTADAED